MHHFGYSLVTCDIDIYRTQILVRQSLKDGVTRISVTSYCFGICNLDQRVNISESQSDVMKIIKLNNRSSNCGVIYRHIQFVVQVLTAKNCFR